MADVEAKRNGLLRRLRLFLLAEADMAQAVAAAMALRDEKAGNGPLRRALETAISVSYARPFASGNRAGTLERKWAPKTPMARSIHRQLLEPRNMVYAHTDKTAARDILDLTQLFVLEEDEMTRRYVEEWQPLDVERLDDVIRVAAEQQSRFRAEPDKLETQLNELR